MKTEMSSFDVMAMVGELQCEMRIKKIYQPSPTELRIQIRPREGGSKNLLVEVGKKMYLSRFTLPSPKFPSNFAMTLRKYLANTIVKEVRQLGFDRIVEITSESRDDRYKVIFELFGEGNVLLIDMEGRIKAVMKRRRYKHRELVGREMYAYPPQRINPFQIAPEKIIEVVGEFKSLVKALAIPLGLGGLYGEEVCLRAGLEKNAQKLSLKEAERVSSVLGDLKNEALNPKPVIVFEDEEPLDVTPMPLSVYEGKKMRSFPSFNEALDDFFTEKNLERFEEEAEAAFKERLTSMNIRLREQAQAIGRFNRQIKNGKLIGDAIYGDFDAVQVLIDRVSQAKKTLSANEINEILKDVGPVKKYLPNENALLVDLEGLSFKLDLSISASKNADGYYKSSKKAKEKLKGARGAAVKTREKIRDYVEKGRPDVERGKIIGVKKARPKRRWFEKFRWFVSSDGFLVIGGRDASTNETLVKRHMVKGDIFVHADIPGAAAVVVKSEGKDIPRNTLDEACQFAAINSIAWRSNAAFLEVYWVNPEQVSKTPKSGEYVSKGAFIIRGKRNYKRAGLIFAVGVKINGEAKVIGGPPAAVEKNSDYHVVVEPGRMKSKQAAQHIKETLLAMSGKEDKEAVNRLNADEIQKVLPTGGYSIVEQKL
jgi:predicted ribosome quality control (RQC) complex YloA/Tae2 family protein